MCEERVFLSVSVFACISTSVCVSVSLRLIVLPFSFLITILCFNKYYLKYSILPAVLSRLMENNVNVLALALGRVIISRAGLCFRLLQTLLIEMVNGFIHSRECM